MTGPDYIRRFPSARHPQAPPPEPAAPCVRRRPFDRRVGGGVASSVRAARGGGDAMKTLIALVERESFEGPAFALDHFQKKVREDLHLEFFLARGRLILTPHLAHLTTDEASPAEEAQVEAILEEKQELLEQIKLYLLYNLSLYSALLETNSLPRRGQRAPGHLALPALRPGRLRGEALHPAPGDPIERYGDRIYLGRDCLPLDSPRRPHLGLGYLRRSLPEQVARLEGRLEKHADGRGARRARRRVPGGPRGGGRGVRPEGRRVLRTYPPEISSRALRPRRCSRSTGTSASSSTSSPTRRSSCARWRSGCSRRARTPRAT